jgi:methylase of polypeptide subunit release factors
MQYKYAREQEDYSDFSSGRVVYSLPGYPAFPVRLASEIFQRCLAQRARIYGNSDPCVVYDPCCGAAYHLSILGYLHRDHIREIIGSDVAERAVSVARQNLSLLSMDGLDRRIQELSEMFEEYGKESHQEALRSASAIKEKLSASREKHPLETRVFQASATDRKGISKHIKPNSVDIVFTDVPYGRHSEWRGVESKERSNPLRSMLEALPDILSDSSILAIASDKGQKAVHEWFQRVEHFQVGKRRIVILRPSSTHVWNLNV